jgi:hypothetical protein
MNKQLWFVFLIALLSAVPASAVEVMVAASADSIVDANNPDVVNNSSPDLLASKQGGGFGTTGVVSTDLRMFYLQFDLPGGLTGQDILALNDVQLKLTRTNAGNLRLNYYVYGVFDGLDSAGVDTLNWNSGLGYNPANVEVRFGTPDEISYYSDPAESAFVGNIRTANDEGPNAPPNPPISVHGPFDFTIVPQSGTATSNLHNLILNDTDGRLTFFVGIQQNFGVATANLIAAVENDTFDPAMLCIDYVPIPEPSGLTLVACGLACTAAAAWRRANRGAC